MEQERDDRNSAPLTQRSSHHTTRKKKNAPTPLPNLTLLLAGLVCLSLLLTACPQPPPTVMLRLAPIAQGLASPVGMAVPNDGSGRLFIVDQVGQIRIIDSAGSLLEDPFLDVSDRLVDLGAFGPGTFDERGLLSMAFHPEFASNGRLFVFYSVPLEDGDPQGYNCRSRISEFLVSADDPDKADPQSETVLLEFPKPQFNHNGGQLAFGPDGLLYISVGDGGGANDNDEGHTPGLGNGQDTTNLFGTILRYNADTPGVLIIPESNPFVDEPEILDPIYAYGLRNPWRFSFDKAGDQRLFCGDAGQDLFEEVNIITAGGNYGWNIKEASSCFNPENPATPLRQCPDRGADGEPLIDPVIEYTHMRGLVVIGGVVYRGTAMPELSGYYLFADWSTRFAVPDGTLFVAEENTAGRWEVTEAGIEGEANGRLNRFVLGFGQDTEGEVYLLTSTVNTPSGSTGEVFKIVPAASRKVEIQVENFRFDADDDNSTLIDTVTITAGDTVRWVWQSGTHTVTSGESSADPDAGVLFDAPVTLANQTFEFTFTEVGTFPYFCRPHEVLNMKGVIEVQ